MLLVLVCCGLVALLLIRLFKQYRQKRANPPVLVTAPWRLPLLGHAVDFVRYGFLQVSADYPRLYGDFVEFFIFSERDILISDAAVAKEVMMANPKRFRRLRRIDYSTEVLGLTTGLLHSNDDSVWSKVRKATHPSFSNQNMTAKFPAVAEEIQAWVQRLKDSAGETIDMSNESRSLTLSVITAVAFGLGVDDPIVRYFLGKEYLDDISDIFQFIIKHVTFPFPLWVWRRMPVFKYERRAVIANNRFAEHCSAVIHRKRQLLAQGHPPASMIDHLIAHQGDGLSDESIVANVKTFYIVGSDTTAITLTWACYYLCINPHVADKLREEASRYLEGEGDCRAMTIDTVRSMQYATAVVKEALRMAAPVFSVALELKEGIESHELSNGIQIRQGDVLRVNLDAMMKREASYADAMLFNPDRWLAGAAGLDAAEEYWMPFGAGPRICPGMTLALSEAVLAVAMLAYSFDMTLDCPKEEIKRIVYWTAAANKMPIKLTPRIQQ